MEILAIIFICLLGGCMFRRPMPPRHFWHRPPMFHHHHHHGQHMGPGPRGPRW